MGIFSISIPVIYANLCLMLVRIIAGSFMIFGHGLSKLNRLTSAEPIKFADPFGLGPDISLGMAVFAEVLCSFLIIIGLGTRLAAIPLIVTMTVAVTYAHAADPFGTKEKPLVYILVFLMLLVFGSGRYSIDGLISAPKKVKPDFD
jgi:putative oxidoreductase